MISSTYSEDDSSTCRMLHRPSISLLQLHLMSLFASGMVMASFVFTPSSFEIWSRYFRRKFGRKVEEPLKLQKHKVIAQAFAKRKVFQNQGRLSISFHNSHTDPVGLKFDVNSAAGSHDFSSTWANNLPRFVNRRYALTGCPSSSRSSYGGRRNSIDSEISFSVRHVSVESRRNSNDSQVSVKIAEMKTKVASRSKSKSSRRRDFKRYNRKESSTSMESQQTAEASGVLVPLNHHKRRSGIADLSPEQINELIAKNRFLLPYLTTSEDSCASFNIQDSKLDAILKQIGLSEHKIIENNVVESDEASAAVKKSLNRSGSSKKGFKTSSSSRGRKGKKSRRHTNPLSGSGSKKSKNFNAIELTNLHGSISGRSDVAIQTELAAQSMDSMEYAENLMREQRGEVEEGEVEEEENFKLIPKNVKRRNTNEISLTESEKLKLLLLPSK